MPVTVTPWPGPGEPTIDAIAGRMRSEGLDSYAWSNGPGDRYSVHEHAYNKVLYCVRGSIRFTLPDEGQDAGVDLRPGDRMELPAGTRHGALVGQMGCQCIEGQRPA